MDKKGISILFIGNSHTYYNDMPFMVQRRFEDDDISCQVVMIAHPGWYLAQHAEEPDVRFNILFGGYDFDKRTHALCSESDGVYAYRQS